jgi:MFS family permease
MRNAVDYGIITAAYWALTLSDGALRMLVLLHLHHQGMGPLALASLFLFYELFGVVTTGLGGWLGARYGLKSTLVAGLGLQVAACGMLTVPDPALTLPWLMGAQALSGIAKDLTKMSAKSYIKLVVPEGDDRGLMRWVSWLTGSKNALKGAGFFLGAWLLGALGFQETNGWMAGVMALALLGSALSLPRAPGKARAALSVRDLVPTDRRIRRLSLARLFLFGARDVWFVVALPLYAMSVLGWSHERVGAFLALWVIGYGVVQASAPTWVAGRDGGAPSGGTLLRWTGALLVPLLALEIALWWTEPSSTVLVVGLALFGVVFAANSAIHSYLIVSYADRDRVAARVGFYYMANASGRLLGTLLSGALYQLAGQGHEGLLACIAASVVLVTFSVGASRRLAVLDPQATR